jgi:hypothetical protein
MPRKLVDIAHVNVRIRENLRRKLEREAKLHRTSLNNEIRLRLEDSFEQGDRRGLDELRRDTEVLLARYAQRITKADLEDGLAQALSRSTDQAVAKLATAWLAARNKTERGAS